MAVNKTGAMFKSLTFDGVDSRNYGVYITGQAVFNAPEREVEMISIPGRNGQFALDMGRFENIEVTYPAGIFANTEAEFAEAVSNFRNLLCSKRGYVRLQDEYHPEEYRMAIYKSGLELENVALKAGEFEITFDCKPQRYLTSGEEEVTVGGAGNTETETGDIVEIDNTDGHIVVQALSVSLEFVQSGTGNPSPDNVRPISGYDKVDVIVSPTSSASDGQTYTTTLPDTVYSGTLDVLTGELVVDKAAVTVDGSQTLYNNGNLVYGGVQVFFTPSPTKAFGSPDPWSDITSDKFVAYQNNASGGCVNGRTANDRLYFNMPSNITTLEDATQWFTDNPTQVVYKLATPQTYQLTPQEIELLLGTNNIWSDGTITVTYAEDLSSIYNPTLFDAEPLLEVEGYGTIGFNGYEITLNNESIGTIELEADSSGIITVPGGTVNVGDTLSFDNLRISTRAYTTFITSSVQGNITSDGFGNSTISGDVDSNNPHFVYWTLNTGAYSTTYTTGITSVAYTLTITASGGTTYTASGTFSLNIDTDSGKITITRNMSAPNLTPAGSSIKYTNIYANSTVSILGNPTYIDCDLGECYMYNDGNIVSLNQYIDLGSDLPKLAPGGNEFTIDNTITELKVVPKWWKV